MNSNQGDLVSEGLMCILHTIKPYGAISAPSAGELLYNGNYNGLLCNGDDITAGCFLFRLVWLTIHTGDSDGARTLSGFCISLERDAD